MFARYFVLILIQLSLISCSGSKIKDFSKYAPAPILKNTLVTDNFNDKNQKTKIVVLEFSENNIEQAKSAKTGLTLAGIVEKAITEDRLAEILDRSAFKKLNDEIVLAELSEEGKEYSGPKNADYAISGTITNAHLSSKFIEGSNYYDFKNYRYVSTPPKIKYEANVRGNLRIYKLPSLEVVEAYVFDGNKYLTENAPKNGNIFNRKTDLSHMKTEDVGLLNEAATMAINNIRNELKVFFSELNHAYIFAKKNYKKQDIFQISMGKEDGLKQGQKIDLFTLQEITNPLTNETHREEIKLGVATVSDQLYDQSSWIIVKDKELAERLKIGDFAKRNFDESLIDKLGSISNKANKILY